MVAPAFSQDKKEAQNRGVYKVEFTIRDGNSATAQTRRRYSMLVEADGRGVFRLGNQVPYVSGTGTSLVNAQYNYADVGVMIECRLREVNSRVSLNTNLEISSVVHDAGIGPNPAIASTRIDVTAELEPGKPAVISTVDDPVTQRKLDIEAMATKVN